jgi:hypothetical protein
MITSNAKAARRRLALSVSVVCAILAFGAFFYFGENREVEARARRIASDKAIWATAEQRGTTYAAVRSNAAGCYLRQVPGGIDPQECEHRSLYGDNYDPIWERQRIIEWMELPLDAVLAAIAGFLSVYFAAGVLHLVRDRWWPWVQGR